MLRGLLLILVMVAGLHCASDGAEPTPGRDAGTLVSRDGGERDGGGANVVRDAGPTPRDGGFDPVTLGPCVAPSPLPPDPLSAARIVSLRNQGVVHMLDIAVDPDTNNVYLVGTGGFFVVSTAAGMYRQIGAQRTVWNGPGQSGNGRGADFAKLTVLGGGFVAITNRDLGLSILDVSTPAAPSLVRSVELVNAAGLTKIGDTLLVLTHAGDVAVFDIADARNPSLIRTLSIFANPWTIATAGDRAYVADNTSGVVVLDVADPTNPIVLGTVPTSGGAQDVTVEGKTLVVAAGGAGIELFDLANPDLPVRAGAVDYGAAVVAVSSFGSYVWGATHEGVVVVDITSAYQPLPVAMEPTAEWAMNVVVDGNTGYIADWSRFIAMDLDPTAEAPAVDPERSELYFLDEPEPSGMPHELELRVDNRGRVNLEISGASVDDPRISYTVDRNNVTPGDTAFFTITFQDDGQPVDAELCIATNDPDQPLQRIALTESTNTNTNTGEAAPDFDLPSVDDDNVRYRLSDELGHPVVLVYFATW